jgi:hypothetical protein
MVIVAHWAERRTVTAKVAGSNPVDHPKLRGRSGACAPRHTCRCGRPRAGREAETIDGPLAQPAERLPYMQDVRGSTPRRSTRFQAHAAVVQRESTGFQPRESGFESWRPCQSRRVNREGGVVQRQNICLAHRRCGSIPPPPPVCGCRQGVKAADCRSAIREFESRHPRHDLQCRPKSLARQLAAS